MRSRVYPSIPCHSCLVSDYKSYPNLFVQAFVRKYSADFCHGVQNRTVMFLLFEFAVYILLYTAFHMCFFNLFFRYEPFVFDRSKVHIPPPTHVATAVLSVNCMSYVIAAVVFSPGPPFRKSIISNSKHLFQNFTITTAPVSSRKA